MNPPSQWRSLEELAQSPAHVAATAREFPEGASEEGSLSRRGFLSIMGASLALASASCAKPERKAVPYVEQPEGQVDGVARYYASQFALGTTAYGVLVKTREGRPIKIEGNPDHPLSGGATCAFAQASVLSLYDPDRMKFPRIGEKDVAWSAFDAEVVHALRTADAQGKAVRLLVEETLSPSLGAMYLALASQLKNATVTTYEPLDPTSARAAHEKLYRGRGLPKLFVDRADVLVLLECDLLSGVEYGIEPIAQFARRRRESAGKPMNRLYAFEAAYTTTGGAADVRARVRPSAQHALAVTLLREVVLRMGERAGARKEFVDLVALAHPASPVDATLIARVAKDLVANAGRGLVVAGPALSTAVHAIVALLNEVLGNASPEALAKPVDFSRARPSADASVTGLRALTAELANGQVGVLITIGGNPAYAAPGDIAFADAMTKAPVRVRLAMTDDETAALSTHVAPLAHALESWGDASPEAGLVGVIQPTILPLFDARSPGDAVLAWAGALAGPEAASHGLPPSFHDFLREQWGAVHHASESPLPFERFWEGALHAGVVAIGAHAGTRGKKVGDPAEAMLERASPEADGSWFIGSSGTLLGANDLTALLTPPAAAGELELLALVSPASYDGRFANNGWLQETPDPVSKLTWDNVASMSRATAAKLGVEQGGLIDVESHGKHARLPVLVQPGMADGVLAVALGYGRTRAGRVGTGVGVDVYPLLDASKQPSLRHVPSVRATRVEGTHTLAITQGHFNVEGRDIARERDHGKKPEAKEGGEAERETAEGASPKRSLSIWKEHVYLGHKWGMAIDMSACVGCNACVVACTAENNVPIIGKEQVSKSRQMFWLRIDRYYAGDADECTSITQPMLCQHCDDAPCENVCPVAATTHSPEGLNQMTYNRCVGTKYCSNNCPYKVRRFNFLNWHEHDASPVEMVMNPDVTVRSRGVMEKCTFCVQRIEAGKRAAHVAGRKRVEDGEVVTACQSACPAGAIVFGDVNDPKSKVRALADDERGYRVLDELNTKSAITYLARVRNA